MKRAFTKIGSTNAFSISLKIAGLYFAAGVLWILLSDKILELLVRDRAVLIDVSILKGWCYVSATTLILYVAVRRWTSQVEHSEKEARLTDAKYRELVESANSIIMRRDITGCITFINEFAQDFFGYSKEEILGRNTVGTIVPEVDRSGRNLKAMIEDIGKHPERYKNNENENMRANGERVWIAWTNKPLRDENGEIVEVLSIGNDITERKQAEQALHKSNARISHLNDVLRAIRDVSSIIESEQEPLKLLTEVCDSLVKTRGYFMAWIGQPEPGSKRVLPVAQSGEGSEFLQRATISWDDSPTGRGPAGTAMRERRPVVFDDLINDERFAPWKHLVNAYGAISTASVPILHHERLFGVLTVNAGRTQAFDEEEIGLLSTLAADVARALQSIEDERARKQAEGALRESEERFRKLFEDSPIGIAFLGKQREIILTNKSYRDFLGYSEAEIIELGPKGLLHPDDWGPSMELSVKLRADEIPLFHMEQRYIRKDGTVVWADTHIIVFRDKDGQLVHTIGWVSDITERKRAEEEKGKLEAELHQARKMEAIGLLAGGIAHDFNNVLAAIMGFTELSLFKISEDSPVRGNLEQVLKAASRASQLVKQILTFTRQGVQERKPVRIAPIVRETLKLLRSSLPSTIEIRNEVAVSPDDDVVLADPGQIHQVLMNLGTNAGHAMRAKGGILSVELSVIADAPRLSAYPDLKAGPNVCITVGDTGHGMDSTVLERIFDPYFTTKAPGEGTGLGLSVVQGIVKSHGGAITVSSEPGQGTTFFVFLPKLEAVDAEKAKALETLKTGSERILLVDDEQALANLGKEILETLGYRVTAMTSSLDALETFRARPDAFDLVISDMTMPSLTGKKLAEAIISLRPNMPIILSTGYSDLVNEKQAKEAGIREFVMKPYEIRTLAGAVRKALEQR